ncbi:MAG: RluA family pseudouridine synthase [Simkaniaceae bacterium]|nr:RluA family pseudouridine synthase [Candidatus Sacchlamyda saccharinae]
MRVDHEHAGKTLLAFLRDTLTQYPSVKAIKRAIEKGDCTINGRVETFSTHRVKEGDEIALVFEEKTEAFPLETLFEDEHLILYNKPPKKASEELCEHFLVHRLDKDTSGVILFAKTKKMQDLLTDLFRKREVEKIYLAICDGKVEKGEWTVDNFLERKASYQGGALYGAAKKGKHAVTHFTVLKTSDTASLVEAKPHTGRTHQIRVHLKEEKHPVLGDYQYGKHFTCKEKVPRQMLHAREIAFVHPITGEEMRISAPLLSDFLAAEKKLFSA